MELENALQQLEALQKRMYAYAYAESAIYLDNLTVAPKDTSEGRGVAVGILSGEEHKFFTAPEVGQMLDCLDEHKDELSPMVRRQAEDLRRQYERTKKVPADEFMQYAMLTNQASDVWHRAKEASDFEMFRPVLEKLVAFSRKFAGYYDSEKDPYDVLLDQYEPGLTKEYLDKFFGKVREKLVPVIHAVGQAEQIDNSFLQKEYPVETQRRFSDYLMEVMGLDRGHCTIGDTKYNDHDLASSMYSVIHESGHALYELGVADELQYTNLTHMAMSIHESQSRFFENLIGRSLPFVQAIFPKTQEFFPEQLKGVTAEQFYRAVNRAEPSLIRTEADELTYCLHIMVRYEIEKQLIGGTLQVKDVPAEWNRLYKEYLGVDVPDDKRGCLQDSHWSGGSFGYFPSYALGSAYGAQMLRNMEKEIDVWGPVAKGDLSKVTAWLREKVHRHGSYLKPAEIVKNACGEFDPEVFTDYLTEKYSKLYDL